MTRDTIKYIAAFTMLLNHIGMIFLSPPISEVFINIGYFTAITMCYFLVEGYHYTHSLKKYGLRLLAFALVSQIPYSIAFAKKGLIEWRDFNILFNLFLCFLILYIYYAGWESNFFDPDRKRMYIAVLMLLSLLCDWSIMAPVFVLLFANAGEDRDRQVRAWGQAILFWGGMNLLTGLSEVTGFGNEAVQSNAVAVSRITAMSYLTAAASYGSGSGAMTAVINQLPQILLKTVGAMAGPAAAGACILFLYNGKRSQRFRRFHQWFFYFFYPGHLMVLGLLRLLTR